MVLETLEVTHFRNFAWASLSLSPHLTLLVGQNGQGKTNLLEAIYLLLQGRDFRTSSERDTVQNGSLWTLIQGYGHSDGGPQHWQHRIQRDPQRRTHVGTVRPVVLFSPDDVGLAKGSPEKRRRFLDLWLGAHDVRYARALRSYQRILVHRNRALKEAAFHSVVDDFTSLLVQEGLYLWKRREEAVKALLPRAVSIHRQLAQGESLSFSLKFGGSPTPLLTETAYQAMMERRRSEERLRQMTLVGPHRDDLVLTIDGLEPNIYASQGQLRTLALSLKLATYHWLRQETGLEPMILLDDVLSELDGLRREAILSLVSRPGQQTVVTDTEPRSYSILAPKIVHVVRGEIHPWSSTDKSN